jgi:hypothetical protein
LENSTAFEQAEGIVPLLTQLLPKEVSQELSALLWAVVHDSLNRTTGRGLSYSVTRAGKGWSQIMFAYHVQHEHMAADEFDNSLPLVMRKLNGIFVSRQYFPIFGFHQFVLRHGSRPYKFIDSIGEALTDSRAAYKILDG